MPEQQQFSFIQRLFGKQGDFEWSYTDEPHATRRKQMLQKYPEIKELYGPDFNTFYKVVFMWCTQVAICWAINEYQLPWYVILAIAYLYGGTVNHSLSLALHELSHGLCFSKQSHNMYFALFANTPMGIPAFVTFRRYHMEHHTFQGHDGVDVDIPTDIEVRLFGGYIGKFFFLLLQPFFYALRPLLMKPKPVVIWEIVNWVVAISFNATITYLFGWAALAYLIGGTLLGMGLHPMAGHFIAEHYTFVKGYETYSYYGPLNYLAFHVGYHNEHHDFPRIPGTKLYRLREIAPEFYDTLPSYTSWVSVLWKYWSTPSMGPHSRVKRDKSKMKKET